MTNWIKSAYIFKFCKEIQQTIIIIIIIIKIIIII